MMKAYYFALLALCFTLSLATTGVDMSSLVSKSSFDCLKSSGHTFAVMRCYESIGRVDPNCAATVANAWDGGMEHVDVYMFPCSKCGNAPGQVTALVNYLKDNKVKYGMIWFDIEGPGSYWGGSQSANAAFFAGLVSQAKAEGVTFGVYTSASQWDPIMGDYKGGADYPLWYAHYDNSPSFSDFAPFGGWTKPSIKQYAGNIAVCGAGVDYNWYP